jgi:hypothetical protein
LSSPNAAYAHRQRVPSASSSSDLPITPSVGSERKEGQNPARSTGSRRVHRAGGITPTTERTRPPQSKPVTHAPRLVAQCAVGGIRAWGESPGRRASPTHVTVLQSRPFVCPDPHNFARTLLRCRRAGGFSTTDRRRNDRWPGVLNPGGWRRVLTEPALPAQTHQLHNSPATPPISGKPHQDRDVISPAARERTRGCG